MTERFYCLNCVASERGAIAAELNAHGRCATCDSDAVISEHAANGLVAAQGLVSPRTASVMRDASRTALSKKKLYGVSYAQFRTVVLAESDNAAIDRACTDPELPWYLESELDRWQLSAKRHVRPSDS